MALFVCLGVLDLSLRISERCSALGLPGEWGHGYAEAKSLHQVVTEMMGRESTMSHFTQQQQHQKTTKQNRFKSFMLKRKSVRSDKGRCTLRVPHIWGSCGWKCHTKASFQSKKGHAYMYIIITFHISSKIPFSSAVILLHRSNGYIMQLWQA